MTEFGISTEVREVSWVRVNNRRWEAQSVSDRSNDRGDSFFSEESAGLSYNKSLETENSRRVTARCEPSLIGILSVRSDEHLCLPQKQISRSS